MKNPFAVTAQLLLIAGVMAGYILFSRSYLHLHYLALSNFLFAAFLLNFAAFSILKEKPFYIALLSASISVIGFFFIVPVISGYYRIIIFSFFIAPAIFTIIEALRVEK